MIYITVICNGLNRLNMGSKTRLITSCTKRRENPANLVTSRKINTRLVRPIAAVRPTCVAAPPVRLVLSDPQLTRTGHST